MHPESLIGEYLEWQGYLVRRNTKVGKLSPGGWEMELDIVAFHLHTHALVQGHSARPVLPTLQLIARPSSVLDRFVVGGTEIASFAERGLL